MHIFRNIFYKLAWAFRKPYLLLSRKKRRRAIVVIEHGDKILLVRHAYGNSKWTFPGGGVKRGELPEEAAKREMLEELGVQIGSVTKIGEYQSKSYKRMKVYCFRGVVKNAELKLSKSEILKADWFSSELLPEPHRNRAKTILAMYKAAKSAA